MNRINWGIEGGWPVTHEDFGTFNTDHLGAWQALAAGLQHRVNGFALSGCVVTDHGGGVYSWTAGYCVIAGEPHRVEAAENVALAGDVRWQVQETPDGEAVFLDGELKNKRILTTATLVQSSSSNLPEKDLPTLYDMLSLLGTPVGAVQHWAGTTASIPFGWLECKGQVVLRADYPELYAVIGDAYATGGEAGTEFRLPNANGRVLAGQDGSNSNFEARGKTGGAETHTLTEDEMPSHTHDFNVADDSDNAEASPQKGSAQNIIDGATAPTGGDQPHNNLQPYLTVHVLIKAL